MGARAARFAGRGPARGSARRSPPTATATTSGRPTSSASATVTCCTTRCPRWGKNTSAIALATNAHARPGRPGLPLGRPGHRDPIRQPAATTSTRSTRPRSSTPTGGCGSPSARSGAGSRWSSWTRPRAVGSRPIRRSTRCAEGADRGSVHRSPRRALLPARRVGLVLPRREQHVQHPRRPGRPHHGALPRPRRPRHAATAAARCCSRPTARSSAPASRASSPSPTPAAAPTSPPRGTTSFATSTTPPAAAAARSPSARSRGTPRGGRSSSRECTAE